MASSKSKTNRQVGTTPLKSAKNQFDKSFLTDDEYQDLQDLKLSSDNEDENSMIMAGYLVDSKSFSSPIATTPLRNLQQKRTSLAVIDNDSVNSPSKRILKEDNKQASTTLRRYEFLGECIAKEIEDLDEEEIQQLLWSRSTKNICMTSTLSVGNTVNYMYQQPEDEAEYINSRALNIAKMICKEQNVNFDELCHQPNCAFQEESFCVGMIACLDDGGNENPRLQMDNCCLIDLVGEITPIKILGKNPESKDASQFSYSLFPGLVVLLEAVNPSGKCLLVKQIYSLQGMPPLNPLPCEFDDLNIVLICGPLGTKTSNPLKKLKKQLFLLKKKKPDLLIVCGPFVVEDEKLDSKKTYWDQFVAYLDAIYLICSEFKIKLLIVPSSQDIHHDFVYPQPPFPTSCTPKNMIQMQFGDYVQFTSDPDIIKLTSPTCGKELSIGVTSTDIMFHLSREEISNESSHRIQRLCRHILTSGSFYPLYPAKSECPIDYTLMPSGGHITERPHLLILRSQLNAFVKDVDGTLCINPGIFALSERGGSFVRISIRPHLLQTISQGTLSSCCAVDIQRL